MLLIAYRGIYDGQNFEDANTPNQIGNAFGAGFSCMIDVWKIGANFYLGTDTPITQVQPTFFKGKRFWISARNSEMLTWLQEQNQTLYTNYFSLPDPIPSYVTTSSGYLWTPGTVPVNNQSILFLPEINDRGLFSTVNKRNYGICSCYCTFIKRMRNEGVWY